MGARGDATGEYFTKYKVKFSLVALSSSEKNVFVKRSAFFLADNKLDAHFFVR
jgi:hypothetical protein